MTVLSKIPSQILLWRRLVRLVRFDVGCCLGADEAIEFDKPIKLLPINFTSYIRQPNFGSSEAFFFAPVFFEVDSPAAT